MVLKQQLHYQKISLLTRDFEEFILENNKHEFNRTVWMENYIIKRHEL
jgi:hypothetical protein